VPFPLHLFNPQQFPRLTPRRVTLVRFARAVSGYAQIDAGDPDDRGFTLEPSFANFHGPAFGLIGPDGATAAQQTRILVVRDRIGAAVQLFPEVGDTSLVSLVSPAAGSPLAPGDIITLRAARAPGAATSTSLRLRSGSASGPVIGECTLRVHPLLDIPVQGHIVTINGTRASSTDQTFRDLLANANKILVSAGIRCTLQPNILETSCVGFRTANAISLPSTGHWDHEIAVMMRRNPQPGVLNAYIVGHIDDVAANGTVTRDNTRGVGLSRAYVASNPAAGTYPGAQVGFLMRDPDDLEGFGATFAHELGHVLELEHYNNKNGDEVQDNIWSMRNLMYNYSDLSTGPPQDQVGYGNHNAAAGGGVRRGMFIGIKRMNHIFQGHQADVMRTAANNSSYMIV
jgi:hypothetical protein